MKRLRHLIAVFDRAGDWILPPISRLVFAAVLLGYFWASALTKFDGIFTPMTGA